MSARHLALRHAEIAAGESVYAAMLRVGDLSGDVWAVDLSGDPVVFASGPGPGPCADLLVRPMSEADLSSLVVWQTMPHVSRWWGDRPRTLGELRAQAGPALAGEGDARLWMVEVNGRPVGFLEDRPVGAGAALPTAAAHDVHIYAAIGDPALVGKGVGTRVVWTFLRDVVQPAHPGAARASRRRTTATRRRCACSTRWASPVGRGSTTRGATARWRRSSSADWTWPRC